MNQYTGRQLGVCLEWIKREPTIERVKITVPYTGKSMSGKLVIVFDCGATNVRVVAVNGQGEIEAIQSLPNSTKPDPHYANGLIWDVNDIWQKFCACTKAIVENIDIKRIAAITVTTFGVNGAPVDETGNFLQARL